MSIRYRFLTAIAVLALAACNGGGAAVATPTPSPTPADGAATTSLVTARYNGNLLYNQPIKLYTNGGTDTAAFPGTLITTVTTDPNTLPTGGQAEFTGLTPLTTYCWTYDYTVSPGVNAHAVNCTSSWGAGFTLQ